MTYIAIIKCKATGEEARYDAGIFDEGSEFCWEEGNYSCDCNRESFFLRAQGKEEPEKIECGEGRYSVILELSNGELIDVDRHYPHRY